MPELMSGWRQLELRSSEVQLSPPSAWLETSEAELDGYSLLSRLSRRDAGTLCGNPPGLCSQRELAPAAAQIKGLEEMEVPEVLWVLGGGGCWWVDLMSRLWSQGGNR